MLQSPAYQPLFERLLAYVSREEFRDELVEGRVEYIRNTGEAFEEDRSFEPRLQGFLDWFMFDRPLRKFGETPARVYAEREAEDSEKLAFQHLSRTVHGVFWVKKIDGRAVHVIDVLTDARYLVSRDMQVWELKKGNLFEGRLVPYEGELHFSSAFLFYAPALKKRISRQSKRSAKETGALSVQDMVFTLARMAVRHEHYRNVDFDDIFDFERPPPKVPSVRIQFDAESVAKRLTSDPPPRSQRPKAGDVVSRK